jgi:hypothetical protein
MITSPFGSGVFTSSLFFLQDGIATIVIAAIAKRVKRVFILMKILVELMFSVIMPNLQNNFNYFAYQR